MQKYHPAEYRRDVGQYQNSSLRLRSAWSYGQICCAGLQAVVDCVTVRDFFVSLAFLERTALWVWISCIFSCQLKMCSFFFLSFESRRQTDVEFFFPSCLQPVCCLYQLLDCLLDYLEQRKALLSKCNRLHKHLESIPSST